ncbi:MAG TPA: NAD(P)/FAD-dependent oxidoreductase [Candidatus Intestinimonas stercoravium]|nr:NAD(P)/FAD-dependent oxidoreductase [Candidatus Intestinimonas stercoravium]
MDRRIVVVGGGAAGMLAALTAAGQGVPVTLLERNPKVGRKLYITGKGRCNVTNDCTAEEALSHVPENGRFLISAMKRFPPQSVMAFFEGLGVPLKTERGGRVFPCSDRASDIIDALFMALRRQRVDIRQDRAGQILVRDGAVVGVKGEYSTYPCAAAVLATGGASYPLTGSTGDGYEMAAALGHTVVPVRPSLIPLEVEGDECPRMQGLSLRNIAVKVKDRKKKVLFQEQGELLFTHFGLSGPLILSASAHMRDFGRDQYTVHIDLKPALDEKTLDGRLLREFAAHPNQSLANVLRTLAPRLLIPILVERSGIPGELPVHSVTKGQRRVLLELFKDLSFPVKGPRPLEGAIITRGGVKTGEIDPRTMESKRIRGLYFAGELIDVDAYTGGFNLQIAWATGRAAGEAAAQQLLQV